MKVLNIQASARTRISIKRAERDAKQDAYDKRVESKTPEFLRVLGKLVQPERTKPELALWLDRKRKDVSVAQDCLQKAKMNVSGVQGQIQMLRSEIDRDDKAHKGIWRYLAHHTNAISRATSQIT